MKKRFITEFTVAIYGYSDRFNHFEGFDIPDENIKSAIYILNKKKLFNQLNKILVNHYNNPLSDNDLSNYIWNKKEVTLSKINEFNKFEMIYINNIEEFISKFKFSNDVYLYCEDSEIKIKVLNHIKKIRIIEINKKNKFTRYIRYSFKFFASFRSK